VIAVTIRSTQIPAPDAATAQYLERINAAIAPALGDLEPAALRRAVKLGRAAIAPIAPEIYATRDINAVTSAGVIPMRLFRPGEGRLPVLVYFPGGGWVLGDRDTHDALCRIIALRSGCAVISVDYRKAPESRFPAAVEDAIATLRWVVANGDDLEIDTDKLAFGGDSAGANIATVAAMAIHQAGGPTFAWQLLLYPIVDRPKSAGSYDSYGLGHSLTTDSMRWFFDQYAPAGRRATSPHWWLTPLTAPSFAGLPATLLVVAGCDPLHDEGVAYAERLRSAGVDVELADYIDQIHGFANTGTSFPRSTEVQNQIASNLRRAMRI
jgi:acetyl esterase